MLQAPETVGPPRWRAAARALAVSVLVLSVQAAAQSSQSVEGWGRVTVLGGYRWVPNWYFAGKAAAAGMPVTRPSVGGPDVIASFGFGASDWLELAVDLFGSYDSFELRGAGAFTAFTYGAVLGPRLTRTNVLFRGFTPYLGVSAGAAFALVNSATLNPGERLLPGLTAVAGFHWRFTERWGVSLDLRWIYARTAIPGISGLNAGGVLLSLGLSTFFPPRPQLELDAPGFGRSSNL